MKYQIYAIAIFLISISVSAQSQYLTENDSSGTGTISGHYGSNENVTSLGISAGYVHPDFTIVASYVSAEAAGIDLLFPDR